MLISYKNIKKLIEKLKNKEDKFLKYFVILDSDECKEDFKKYEEDSHFKFYTFEEVVEAG